MAIHPTRKTLSRRLRLLSTTVGSSLAVALLISGCAPGDPDTTPLPEPPSTSQTSASPTPSPTSGAYYAPEPISEEQAIADATRAYEFYLATAAEIYANPSDSSRIDEIAKQDAAFAVHDAASSIASSGAKVLFSDRFELNSADSFALETPYPDGRVSQFGSVHLFGCLDMSARTGTNADGDAIEVQGEPRVTVHVTGLYDIELGRWFIFHEETVGESDVTPC